MVIFDFSFQETNPTEPVGFEIGDIDLAGSLGAQSSKNKLPCQSMMLILSISSLLDGFRRFILDDATTNYEFIASDSSFQIVFTRSDATTIRIECNTTEIDVAPIKIVVSQLKVAVKTFFAEYSIDDYCNKAESDDLKDSWKDFSLL